MKSKKYSVITLSLIIIFCGGCSEEFDKEYDAQYWAKIYCNCLEENSSKFDAYNARIICDSKINLENRFFRTYSASGFSGDYLNSLPAGTKDSVLEFNRIFNIYLFDSCKNFLLGSMVDTTRNILDK
jgi:hypothetical protein